MMQENFKGFLKLQDISLMQVYHGTSVRIHTYPTLIGKVGRNDVSALTCFMTWFFTIDNYKYARWFSIHIFDLSSLEFTGPSLYEEFNTGNFSFSEDYAEIFKPCTRSSS